MGKYAEKLSNVKEVDISETGVGGGDMSSNTKEPATHVNRMAEARALTTAQIRALERLEGKFEGGGVTLTAKEKLLDAREVEAANPDLKVRWLSLRNTEKLDARIEEGYEKLSEADGGRQLGDSMALFGQPRRLAEARAKRQEQITRQRLGEIKDRYAEAGERLAHDLKRNHGLSDSQIKRLIINE